MPTFTSLVKLKLHLGIPSTDTSEDDKLNQFITEIESSVLSFLKRGSFTSASYTEYHSGNDREKLILKKRPVTAITSIHVDSTGYAGQGSDAFAASTLWVSGTDYWTPQLSADEENGSLIYAIGNNQQWPLGRGNIKVVYTAGYSVVPDDLALAVNQLIAAVRAGAERGGQVGEETFGEYSYTLLKGGDLTSLGMDAVNAGRIIARYREVCA